MAFMFNAQRQPMSVSARARTEAYAGLLLLLFAVTVLAFNRCGSPLHHEAPSSSVSSSSSSTVRPLTKTFNMKSQTDTIHGVTYGNAWHDGKPTGGWWTGHFINDDNESNKNNNKRLRHVMEVETKWAMHKAGKKHDKFSTNSIATSMAVLISGRHRLEFSNGAFVVLEYPGDYVVWAPGIAHSWTALQDSTMLSIRWPSIPGDQGQHTPTNYINDTIQRTSIRSSTQLNYNNTTNATNIDGTIHNNSPELLTLYNNNNNNNNNNSNK